MAGRFRVVSNDPTIRTRDGAETIPGWPYLSDEFNTLDEAEMYAYTLHQKLGSSVRVFDCEEKKVVVEIGK